MILEGKNRVRFMISVALACTGRDPPSLPLDAEEAADYLADVLGIALGAESVSVEAVSYPVTTKAPVCLSAGDGTRRMFWYYPLQDNEILSGRLADIVSELSNECTAPAIA